MEIWFWLPMATNNFMLLIFFYVNMLVLIPRLLRKRGWAYYFGAILICFLSYQFVASTARETFWARRRLTERPAAFNQINPSRSDVPERRFEPPRSRFFGLFELAPFLLVFGLSTSLRFSEDFSSLERQQKEKENENLKSEVSLLRSQISPHFMFNVLNSLAAMARKKSDKMEEAVINLSYLMRYMIYYASREKTVLGDELGYLESYVELQMLRFGNQLTVELKREGIDEKLPLEPMLLVPFVENAFKHGTALPEPTILISVTTSNKVIDFTVRNKVSREKGEMDSTTGFGLQNLKRRLQLLYAGNYSLRIEENNDWFEAQLILKVS